MPDPDFVPGLRVLVVDDDRDNAESLRLLAEIWGHDVRAAFDGRAALRDAAELKPDAILLDLAMPGMDGFELAGRLRDAAGDVRPLLVAVSGLGRDSDRRRSAEAGIHCHVLKGSDPVELETLLATLGQVRRAAGRAEELAGRGATLADEARETLRTVRGDVQAIKDEVRGLRQAVREVQEMLAG